MASGETTSVMQCPECDEPIEFPVSARHVSKTKVALSVDLTPVREHAASHQTRFATELPTVTVRMDNRDAHFIPAQASDSDDDPPVQCWHYGSGSPCDWNVCRQPERLANGDTGTDPATRP